VLADPIRSNDYSRYRGVHCMTPNRLEAQLATGMTIRRAEDAILVGQKLVESLDMEAVLITLDRDGMALVRADGRAEVLPTRPRQVYDITGAGDMVLAVVGLCIASGADYAEAAALGNVAGGLEVEKFGVSLLTRNEIHQDLIDHHGTDSAKILDRDRLKVEVMRRHRAGQTIGFTNGCFDLLHRGHVALLRQAAAYCDFLAVGVNSDASVKRLKGPGRPINPAEARADVLAAIEAVDAVTIFDEDTPLELISAILPDVLIKGGDYRPDQVVGRDEVEAAGGRLVIVPLFEGHSTSSMARRLAASEAKAHAGSTIPPPHHGRTPTPAAPPPVELRRSPG
jgi:D-beta-D-heptose 7-phosphate kinase/D-beta-D-heptose 1-phosphate adenosyltransferase